MKISIHISIFTLVLISILFFFGSAKGYAEEDNCPKNACCFFSRSQFRGSKFIWYKRDGTVDLPNDHSGHVGSYIANIECCLHSNENEKYHIRGLKLDYTRERGAVLSNRVSDRC
ncbi:hypothetical protein PPL_10663 [Heterostelium album PN500]|uniref:Uncharacterized protein n=1 Tax=Heterostelium pallidum (strain ATCC 26659 / Pp 5 / PN500) TaxID=670386 RepID=D3BRQ2_HETP5|nr:hypothetical protein PPL_10663 [Heterostelium album PN500]EFA76084.1 hypothetical protein PPL_10663 [Heterostelium album PN500]|eukprot:XP_020428218.1 hypothetical protein PPL_10663 [Heterostelium album PN500]